MVVVIEILEKRVAGGGCSTLDRRTFRRRTLGRLLDEFGDRLHVVWEEPSPAIPTLPTIIVGGRVIHEGGYLPWEVARPIVAHALAVEESVEEFRAGAAAELASHGIDAADWQNGMLTWLCGPGGDAGDGPSLHSGDDPAPEG
ncbi:MAG: hypothetical protein ACYC5Q_11590 [Thermoleophilia bacterium]